MKTTGNSPSAGIKEAKGSQAVNRALDILSCFDFSHFDWSASELSKKLGLTMPTTQRMLKALESKAFLSLNKRTGRFEIGLHVFELGAIFQARMTLIHQAKDVLIRLRDETKESALLGMIDGDEVVFVMRMDSLDVFGSVSPVGLRRPLVSGSFGKAILALYPQPAAEKYLSSHVLTQYTPRSITNKAIYIKELGEVKKLGYAIDREEVIPGICAIASAIAGEEGFAVGSVAVVFPAIRYSEIRIVEWGQLVRQAGLNISQRLSYMMGESQISYDKK
jgi:IclR family transcriptional regulator, acetate operon repressor